MHDSIIALIPARGGSKGIPKKNIRPLMGYPLIAYSIAAARRCKGIDRVVVSTDSPEIREVALAWEAEVPFLRPERYATDTSPDIEFIRHALGWFKEEESRAPEFLLHLRPTTPLRDPDHLQDALQYLRARPDATSLRSAHEIPEPPQKMFGIEGEYFVGLFPQEERPEYYNLPRQSFSKAYHPNGYVDIIRPAHVEKAGSLHGPRILAFVTPFSIEIDTEENLLFLECFLERIGHPILDLLKKA
jgi:CMP-N-acetylneuraminic acid synthetase